MILRQCEVSLKRPWKCPVLILARFLKRETVRKRIAGLFQCHEEEVALTRNASEGLQICQLGFDLNPGDEILTTDQDYPRMITTWKQRERRDGIVLKQFAIPVPSEDPTEIVSLFESNITSRTKLILIGDPVPKWQYNDKRRQFTTGNPGV